MIKISNLKIPLEKDSKQNLEQKIKTILKCDTLPNWRILRRSIDARRKGELSFIYQVAVDTQVSEALIKKSKYQISVLEEKKSEVLKHGTVPLKERPLVVGFGPAGLFAAYELALEGYQPIVLEQGEDVDQRTLSVEKFWQEGILNEKSNVQFGEGGAGAFSDGKLTSRSKNPLVNKVLRIFVEHGAPENILYDQKPHLGTDVLKGVIKNIRETIIAHGGEVHFNEEVLSLICEGAQVQGVRTTKGEYRSSCVLLGIGHSARALFRELHRLGIALESKPFAVGFRIEHPQLFINKHQYREYYNHPKLGAADYQLTYHDKEGNRGIYTFCMCPGGCVVGAASEKNRMVVNGMSYHARDKENANSAVLVTIDERDYGEGILAGLEFQEKLEEKCFQATTRPYNAPVQTVADFLANRKTLALGKVQPSVKPGYELSQLNDLLPQALTEALQRGLRGLDRKFHGFAMDEAILTGVESRSSSPIRIVRQEKEYVSTSHEGLYPMGEGAGYAGGIVSSAVDGLKVADYIISRFNFKE